MERVDTRIEKTIEAFAKSGYILHNQELATVIFLAERLEKPLLLEGEPGVGKTAVAQALAGAYGRILIRLQCYEGLDANMALYEWNYAKQLLHIRMSDESSAENPSTAQMRTEIYGEEFLLKRPLLQAIQHPQKVVLLVDEIDRADEEFEAFLLEVLSEFQISIPELGTIRAKHKPAVILTSNRSRELGDALKRRCLYHWLDHPSLEMEMKIVSQAVPELEERLIAEVVGILHRLRKSDLEKRPGIAEAIDWAKTLLHLNCSKMSKDLLRQTAGVFLKNREDLHFLDHFFTDAETDPATDSETDQATDSATDSETVS